MRWNKKGQDGGSLSLIQRLVIGLGILFLVLASMYVARKVLQGKGIGLFGL